MANNRQVSSLTDLAFQAFLRARQEIDFEIPSDYQAVIDEQVANQFLRAIANANSVEVKAFLDQYPEWVVSIRGTVTTASGYTYENVSAIELAYLMDDDALIRDELLPAIQKLSPEMIKIADDQLTHKMAEVEKQKAQFKPYDFDEIIKVMVADSSLSEKDKPNEATQKALAKLKEDFKPGNIKEGRVWIKEQLQEAHRLYDKNWWTWGERQLCWYSIHVIGHLQTLVETCFEQECSQGLEKIVKEKKPNARCTKIDNHCINDVPLITYRGTTDSSLLLGRDFYVEMLQGGLRQSMARRGVQQIIKELGQTKKSAMDAIKQQLDQLYQQALAHQQAPCPKG